MHVHAQLWSMSLREGVWLQGFGGDKPAGELAAPGKHDADTDQAVPDERQWCTLSVNAPGHRAGGTWGDHQHRLLGHPSAGWPPV